MALALKVNPTTYPVYKNVMVVLGKTPELDMARLNGQFVVLRKIAVPLAVGIFWQIEYYEEREFRESFRWTDGPSWEEFTEVEEIPEPSE